jgi:radical SAM superfamily enzyme YgiQ (UPF0313 family)
MHIAIINMPCRTDAEPNIVPLGIYYVGNAIRRHLPVGDVQISYMDLNLIRPATTKLVEHHLCGLNGCDLYLLSGLITTLRWQEIVAKYIRKWNPKAKIVTGGGLATNIGPDLAKWIDVNAVAIGEGENTIGSILRDCSTGSLKVLYGDGPVKSLDAWDMSWSDVQGLERYITAPIWGGAAGNSSYSTTDQTRSINMITSRGCPMECAFCSREATGGRVYRTRSADSVINEVRYLVETHNVNFIGFMDDNMCVDRDRMYYICKGLAPFAEKGLRWGCHARFDMHYELPEFMAMAGCRHIGFGAESASEKILKAMKKRQSPSRMRGMIERCRAVGIHPNCTWIMGWPGETIDDLQETVRFIQVVAPENQSMFVATAYPGTDLWGKVEKQVLMKYRSVRAYVEALGDATLPLMNYSAMSDGVFFSARKFIEQGQMGRIL